MDLDEMFGTFDAKKDKGKKSKDNKRKIKQSKKERNDA